ncbi:hypothetical protein [Sphingomonas mali]|jgi:hypothetical protein|uniref:hypothetical protein n=1 Tax=Sphingomonas mali TaxID=40682 RepID=UPI000837451B|nr:hypothetical protein [Sphingomonas mali]
MPILFLLAAASLVPQEADDNVAVDISPGHCVAAADRLDDAVRLAREMLDSKSAAGGPDRTPTEARVARAQAVAAAIRTRFPKVAATDDDRDDISGGDVMPFAEQCLTAKPPKGK